MARIFGTRILKTHWSQVVGLPGRPTRFGQETKKGAVHSLGKKLIGEEADLQDLCQSSQAGTAECVLTLEGTLKVLKDSIKLLRFVKKSTFGVPDSNSLSAFLGGNLIDDTIEFRLVMPIRCHLRLLDQVLQLLLPRTSALPLQLLDTSLELCMLLPEAADGASARPGS